MFGNSQSFIAVLFFLKKRTRGTATISRCITICLFCVNETFLDECTLDHNSGLLDFVVCVDGTGTMGERSEALHVSFQKHLSAMWRFSSTVRSLKQHGTSFIVILDQFYSVLGTDHHRIDTRLQRGMETIVGERCCSNCTWGFKCPSLQMADALQRYIGRKIGFASLLFRERLEATCEYSNARKKKCWIWLSQTLFIHGHSFSDASLTTTWC